MLQYYDLLNGDIYDHEFLVTIGDVVYWNTTRVDSDVRLKTAVFYIRNISVQCCNRLFKQELTWK